MLSFKIEIRRMGLRLVDRPHLWYKLGNFGKCSTRAQGIGAFMSEKHPECPLYNPLNCKEYHNPKLCAFARRDRTCLKKKKPRPKSGAEEKPSQNRR
jgi:hypothetical protein